MVNNPIFSLYINTCIVIANQEIGFYELSRGCISAPRLKYSVRIVHLTDEEDKVHEVANKDFGIVFNKLVYLSVYLYLTAKCESGITLYVFT